MANNSPDPLPPAPLRLAALCALGFLASLWALFQWGELLVARAGGVPFCAAGDVVNCTAVWDSGFAKWMHDVTNVPVAGWGLMWGITAFALPLLALALPGVRGVPTALRLAALAGVLSVGGLAAASAAAGALCIGCIGTYIVVVGWCALAWLSTKGFGDIQRGVFLAGGITLAAYLALLYPGTRTPHALDGAASLAGATPVDGHAHGGPTAPVADPGKPGPFDGPSTGDPGKDAALEALIADMPREAKQRMADLLGAYEQAPRSLALPDTRVAWGTPGAPVRIVDWTDPLCPHCASLHAALAEIHKLAPGTIAVESHFFPLDGLCNSKVDRKNESGEVRCLASKALICLEGDAEKFHLGQKLIFEAQSELSVDKVWEVLKPITDRKALEACIASPDTQKKLDADAAAADANDLHGTPLVLLNGKEVSPSGPILYALALTGGSTKTAAFKTLPAPRPIPKHEH